MSHAQFVVYSYLCVHALAPLDSFSQHQYLFLSTILLLVDLLS